MIKCQSLMPQCSDPNNTFSSFTYATDSRRVRRWHQTLASDVGIPPLEGRLLLPLVEVLLNRPLPLLVELGDIEVELVAGIAREGSQPGGGPRVPVKGIFAEIILRALDDEDVDCCTTLAICVAQVHVDIEGILDHVTQLFDNEQTPADEAHYRDHDPLQAVHQDEGEGEAPHGQETRQVARVKRWNVGADDTLWRKFSKSQCPSIFTT
jgi:hypothetical protein